MNCTGIIRRTDDLGRVVIPKEIRRILKINEGEPLEIFIDTENQMVCFQKHINTKKLSERCKQIVSHYRNVIMSVNLTHYTTTIVTTEGEIGQATWNEEGEFDINIGIAYALVNAGYLNKEEIEED